jgi:hypothetical protein
VQIGTVGGDCFHQKLPVLTLAKEHQMRVKRLLLGLGAANLLMAAALLARPAEAQLKPDGSDGGVYNCCKLSTAGESYCCSGCCWNPLVPTCKASSECR